jgi:predicted Rossmann fold flavoprotein
MTNTRVYDVVVIGGGPAGMMAAARGSARGRSVILLEKNPKLGKKLAITGGGRCNVTNNKPVVREMLRQYKDSGKFLFSTFMQHGVSDSIDWFAERKVTLVEENEGRLFPASQKAETIRACLIHELQKTGVEVKTNTVVSRIEFDKGRKVFKIKTSEGNMEASACVVATGGTSRPETGSTGEGFKWLKSLGHTIISNNMALVPMRVNATWLESLAGITLSDVKLTLFASNKKISVHNGKLLFTHVGITGPTVLNLSKQVGELLEGGEVILKVDLLPKFDEAELKEKLYELLVKESNKKIKNILSELLPVKLSEVILEIAKIDGDTKGHSVTKGDRTQLLQILKSFPLLIKGLLGPEKAVVSSGGVALEEINFKSMESRVVPGLFLVGDILNINRPSGGYSLQLCWSTGFVAGNNV